MYKSIGFKTIFLVFAILFVLLGLTSCKRESATLELLKNNTCKLPCFYGIVPGKSTRDDVELSISNIPGDKRVTWADGKNSEFVQYEEENLDIEVHLENKTTSLIGFYNDRWGRNLNLQISDVIKVLGEPSSFIITKHRGEVFFDMVNLLFPEKNTIVLLWKNSSLNKLQLNPNYPVYQIQIYTSQKYNGQVEEIKIFNTTNLIHIWKGYTTYIIDDPSSP